jgi:hypothetical protein
MHEFQLKLIRNPVENIKSGDFVSVPGIIYQETSSAGPFQEGVGERARQVSFSVTG